jgi:hypothetical protein
MAREHADIHPVQELTPEKADLLSAAGINEAFPFRALRACEGPAGVGIWSRHPVSASDTDDDFWVGRVTAKVRIPDAAAEATIVVTHLSARAGRNRLPGGAPTYTGWPRSCRSLPRPPTARSWWRATSTQRATFASSPAACSHETIWLLLGAPFCSVRHCCRGPCQPSPGSSYSEPAGEVLPRRKCRQRSPRRIAQPPPRTLQFAPQDDSAEQSFNVRCHTRHNPTGTPHSLTRTPRRLRPQLDYRAARQPKPAETLHGERGSSLGALCANPANPGQSSDIPPDGTPLRAPTLS